MKKFLTLILFFGILLPAQASLDGGFDYMNIPSEHLEKINFRKDTIEDILSKFPEFKKSTLDDGQIILLSHPSHSPYSEIRIGFTDKKLEWIEFILKEQGDINNFIVRYGTPDDVNVNYHPTYDYYDYSFFNVSADKKGEKLYSITLFDNPKTPEELKELNAQLPAWDKLSDHNIFIPGNYLEATFGDEFVSLYPKFNEDGTKTYILNKNVTTKYQKAEIIFKDGLLKKLVLYPHNLSLAQIKSVYGPPSFKEENKDKIIHRYNRFSVTTDSKNNVIKITI